MRMSEGWVTNVRYTLRARRYLFTYLLLIRPFVAEKFVQISVLSKTGWEGTVRIAGLRASHLQVRNRLMAKQISVELSLNAVPSEE